MDIFGTDKSSTHIGSLEGDVILARGGADQVSGRNGNDTILGGDGHDNIKGGRGDDLIYGHSEGDALANAGRITAKVLTNIGNGAVAAVAAPGDDGFLYALNKDSGVISRIDTATGAKTTFLDIPQDKFSSDGERGVLNVAFHPDYASNGRFFVYLTNADGDVEVREYARSGDETSANATMVQSIITIAHPGESNHNGGAMVFGPDGMLYLGLGDGGGGNDPNGNAQNKNELLGKILRLDINGDDFGGDATRNYTIPTGNPFAATDGRDEIFALGVRNPFRISSDPATGDLYIGDVGQSAREEVDYLAAGTGAGRNFGWNVREGTIAGPGSGGAGPFTDPLIDYGRDVGQVITGGVVYRGTGGLQGAYFYADFGSGRLFTLRAVDGKAEDAIDRTDQVVGADIASITSFGTDSSGRLYAVTYGGDIIRLTPSATAGDSDDDLNGGAGNDKIFGGFGDDQLAGDRGNDTLSGGVGADTVVGGDGRDIVSYAEKTDGVVVALSGQATVTVVVGGVAEDQLRAIEGVIGGSGRDSLTGDSIANILEGGKGADSLDGGGANDTLAGGRGFDTVTGGTGADRFVFDAKAAADVITDFGSGNDRLVFDRSVFTRLHSDVNGTIADAQFHASHAGVAQDRNDRLIYDTDDGRLYYDADGNRHGHAVLIATLAGAPHLTTAEIFVV